MAKARKNPGRSRQRATRRGSTKRAGSATSGPEPASGPGRRGAKAPALKKTERAADGSSARQPRRRPRAASAAAPGRQAGSLPLHGTQRVIIEGVWPELDAGRWAIKRTVGERVEVEADLVADGHDQLVALLLFRHADEPDWQRVPMEALGNDRWRAAFSVENLGTYLYTIVAWVDRFATWVHGLRKKVEAQQDVTIDLQIGAELVGAAAGRATGPPGAVLRKTARYLADSRAAVTARVECAFDETLSQQMAPLAERSHATRYARELKVTVDREVARFATWYELFPRSCSDEPGRHGTFEDCEKRLPYIAGMGFDVVYLPPIHPIGTTHRKGPNNVTHCEPDDPGSPWAIGSAEGGHTAVHAQLGTLESFRRFVQRASEHGLEVALDIAFQCSPDHPSVAEHPEWFRWRPDGTVQYAENPPKKYQDIYPFEFESETWPALWEELKGIFEFWIRQGVKVFRVDNPHTKPLRFWEWLIAEVKREHPDTIFLAEAFTRPKVMYALAKLGFSQSYTYFTWRNFKWELTEYLEELTKTGAAQFFRPSFWPNTPDILHVSLQQGGPPAFRSRLVLAATLSSLYGIYGPAFELCVNVPREPGSEEYLNSEKYEIKTWDLDSATSIRPLIAAVNEIRHDNPALQTNRTLRFHGVDNDALICYSKTDDGLKNIILVVVNLDPDHRQSGFVNLDLGCLGLTNGETYEVHDLLANARHSWTGAHNYVELDPVVAPAHIFRIGRMRSARG